MVRLGTWELGLHFTAIRSASSLHTFYPSVSWRRTQLLFLARKGVAMRTFESFTGRHDDRRLAFVKDDAELRAGPPQPPPQQGDREA